MDKTKEMNYLEGETIAAAELLYSLKFISREKRNMIIRTVKSPEPNTGSCQSQTTEAR